MNEALSLLQSYVGVVAVVTPLVAIAVIAGLRSGSRRERSSWIVFLAKIALPMAPACVSLILLFAWTDWKLWDDRIQAEMNRAVSVRREPHQDGTKVFLEYPNGSSGIWIRRSLKLPWYDSMAWGIAAAFGLGGLALAVRRVAAWRLYERFGSGCCQHCGYDLTGNISGKCPECGSAVPEAIGATSGAGRD